MAFPPNYRQERNNRERAKQRKALEKQQKREEASAQRKQDLTRQDANAAPPANPEDNGHG